ncbi:MAG TPA: PQQ-dependent dehydrogenase, methanol/ethanol family [Nevskiaceae bacterium]|nr:PQQ-dependent dehydrogenase, methanol/ethanol family [Nevskiaceae bacterium]
MHKRFTCAALAAIISVLAVQAAQATTIDNAALTGAGDGSNWPEFGGQFSEQRYSPLDQVNKDNVKRLGLAWSMEVPDVWNVSSAPVEVDGTLYFAVGFSVMYAVEAATGKVLWKYDPHVSRAKMRMAWGIRGMAYWNGKVYAGVQDGRLYALDAKSGALLWETQTLQPGDRRYITGAPRVFNGKIIIGHGGADFGHVRGYVTAYDAETGKQIWRWYAVPGNPKDGFEQPELEMAAKTWSGDWWKYGGGGTVWNAMTYDPEFNRVYLGTGNGSPWNAKLRNPGGGDNLFLCSVVALDADTGKYLWHYQTNPNESWDFNSDMDMVLATLPIDGKPRKLLLHAPKNGFFYVIDRETGKLVSAEKLGKVTWADHIDLATGRPVENRGVRYKNGETLMWPGSGGIHNWQPMSFSPDTALTYIPAHEMAGYYDDRGIDPQKYDMDSEQYGPLGIAPFFDDVPKSAGSSSLIAWDAVKQKAAWTTPTPGATNGGVMSTHGGLVFQGQADGRFVAHDAATGAELWSYDMGVGTQAPPITYTVDGRQYVTVLAGWAGGHMLMGSLDAQHGWVGRNHPRRVLTFVLDGKAQLPPSPPPSQPQPVDDASFQVDHALAEKGKIIYAKNCVICHGTAGVAGGAAPDLRASPVPLSADSFNAVVHGGALEPRGMPVFEEFSVQDLDALRHYIRERARDKPGVWQQIKNAWHFIWLMIKQALIQRGWMSEDG